NNFEHLIKIKKIEILARIPLIPKITATRENLTQLSSYIKSLGINEIVLLPYNPLWLTKAEAIGVVPKYTRKKWMNEREKAVVKEIFTDFKYKDF
ncbi:MAG TPA: hypothetical protein VGB37_08180, partial [Candidatus Lokiarchaeia archaeon]